jgi:di/tricarboxylate transporter
MTREEYYTSNNRKFYDFLIGAVIPCVALYYIITTGYDASTFERYIGRALLVLVLGGLIGAAVMRRKWIAIGIGVGTLASMAMILLAAAGMPL